MSERREKKLLVNHTFARRELLEHHVKSERSKLIIVIIRRELKGQCITIISSLLSATAGSPQATYQECAKLKSLSPKFSDLRTSQTALFTNWSVPQRNISPQSKLNRNCNILNIRIPHPHTIFRLEFCRNLPCFFWGFKQVWQSMHFGLLQARHLDPENGKNDTHFI